MPPHHPGPPVNGDGSPLPTDRFHPSPLSPTALAGLQHALTCRERRRHAYRAGPLRVCVDGDARGTVDPRGSVGAPMRVPLTASCVEIVGEDAEGALLLAVCPLPDPDVVEAAGVAHVSVTLEGGQTVALTLALGEGSNGEAPTYVLQLTYADPAPVVLLLPGPPP